MISNLNKEIPMDKNGLYLLNLIPSVKSVFARRVAYKKVILLNPSEFEDIHLARVAATWNGLGFYEVELMLAFILVSKIIEANISGKTEVDITDLFSSDMAFRGYLFTTEAIRNHIIKSFDIVSETDEELRVKL